MDYAGLGVAGAVIAAFDAVYYFWTIIKGQTRPHRITWFGWTLISVLGTWAAIKAGAGPGSYVIIVDTAIVAGVFLLSLVPKYGKPGGQRLDYAISVFAVLAIILWQTVHFSPGIAATIAVVADFWFAWLTIRECWRQPETESVASWIISIFANGLGVAALSSFSYASAAYPVYVLVGNSVIASVLLTRRTEIHKKPHDTHPPIL